jgi:hypothetical protein
MKRRTMGMIAAIVLAVVLVLAVASAAFAMGPFRSSSAGAGPTPTAIASPGAYGFGGPGPGAMMGAGFGYGPRGMMSPWAQSNATGTGQPITLDQAQTNVQAYLRQLGNADLVLDEVMEFQYNFYAIVKEKGTGVGAFEVLVNKFSGAVVPEPGPNMVWNTKYGMMAQNSWMAQHMGYSVRTGPMTVGANQAKQIAQTWLDQNQPGSTTETPDQFYGYYTLHILKDGKVTGMLSVNGYTGQVWYHAWHGAFIQMKDLGT